MSKTAVVTDPLRTTTVTFTSPSPATQNATTGQFTPASTTVAADVEGDLQPLSGDMRQNMTGLDPQSTHVFIPLARVSGLAEEQMATDANSQRYRVAFVQDYGSGLPQEVILEKLSDPGEN